MMEAKIPMEQTIENALYPGTQLVTGLGALEDVF